jgi:tetratricopeptide (TPR) repeat protein
VDDRLRQSLLSNLEALRTGLSVELGSSNTDLFNLYKLHGPKEPVSSVTSPEKEDEFSKYIDLLNKKGYFNGTEPGTPAYEARLEKARTRFAAKYIKNPEQHKDAGNEFVRQGNYKEALNEYNLAIEGDANNAIYYANRGLAHQKLFNHNQAITDLEKAISLNPNYSKTYPRLATCYITMGNVNKAIEITDKGLALEPNNESLLKIKADLNSLGAVSNAPPGDLPFPVPPGMPNFFELMNNPEFMAMATQLVQNNPEVMNFARQVAENPQMLQQMFTGMGTPPNNNTSNDM